MPASGTLRRARLGRYVRQKVQIHTGRPRAVRFSLLIINVLILVAILTFVIQHPKTASQPVSSEGSGAAANPLDQLSSVNIAQTVAQLNSLPETVAIANQAQSQAAEVAIATSDNNVVSKPQVVDTALKSKADIQVYVTQPGDTLASLAAKFGVTSTSILWSNGLTVSNFTPGTHLTIPPVNGVVYTVKAGDTPVSLAAKYSASADQIIAYNDAELSGLQVGEQIIIPNATQTVGGVTASNIARGFPWGSSPIYGYNGYDYGYCTWYVATQIPVPANWGNASSWAYFARMSGWHVSSTPTVGAIAQKGGGEGHVGIVIGVNPDGTVTIRDMNGFAGWGRVGTGTVSTGTFQNFITH